MFNFPFAFFLFSRISVTALALLKIDAALEMEET